MKVLVTAGPTREPIDAVRFISNRSSGRMGLAVAAAAAAAGHDTTLLLGPVADHGRVSLCTEAGVRVEQFDTGEDLLALLKSRWPSHDVLVMVAAVADYRPRVVPDNKLSRSGEDLTLQLVATQDLVASMAAAKRPDQYIVAFALEDIGNLEQHAARKLQRKGVDAIVANPLSTMDDDSITPLWLTADGNREAPGTMVKEKFARWLVGKLVDVMGDHDGSGH